MPPGTIVRIGFVSGTPQLDGIVARRIGDPGDIAAGREHDREASAHRRPGGGSAHGAVAVFSHDTVPRTSIALARPSTAGEMAPR